MKLLFDVCKKIIKKLFGIKYYYKIADSYGLAVSYLKARESNRKFTLEYPDFPLPPVRLAFDAYAHISWNTYRDKGLEQAELFSRLIKEYSDKDKVNVLDWGCGPARIIRHMPLALKPVDASLYGSDFNEKTIKWCSRNFKDIRFSLNSIAPPLCYEDGLFHCVYNVSVFTHLSLSMHYEWMKELSRIMRKDAIFIFTTQGGFFKKLLTDEECELFDRGELVVRRFAEEGKKFYSAFHPEAFVRQEMLKGYEVLCHIKGNDTQDVWVAKKV